MTDMAMTLSGLRLAIGTGAWAAPDLAGKPFGIVPADNDQGAYLARLFGARDVALGVGTARSSGDARKFWLQLGVAVDLLDAAAGVIAGRSGQLGKVHAVMATGTALSAAALGIAALANGD